MTWVVTISDGLRAVHIRSPVSAYQMRQMEITVPVSPMRVTVTVCFIDTQIGGFFLRFFLHTFPKIRKCTIIGEESYPTPICQLPLSNFPKKIKKTEYVCESVVRGRGFQWYTWLQRILYECPFTDNPFFFWLKLNTIELVIRIPKFFFKRESFQRLF